MGRFFILFLFLQSAAGAGPLSERILFVADYNGLKKLYICRIDGRDLQRFCRQPGHQLQPSYSRTLKRVFYVRPLPDRSQICSVNNDGRDFRVEVDLRAESQYPDVSPDGRTLLFSTDMWGAFELAEFDLSTRKLERLTYDQSINTHGRYSPSGESVLFLTRRQGWPELFLLHRETGSLEQVTDTPFPKSSGSWHPSGTRMVATEARPPRLRRMLLEKDLESDEVRYLLPKVDGLVEPVYSVDGTQILFLEDGDLYTYDPSDTVALPFPLRGRLYPEEAIWIEFPLP